MNDIAADISYIYFDFDNVLARRIEPRAPLLAGALGIENSSQLRDYYISGFHSEPSLRLQYDRISTITDEITFYSAVFSHFLSTHGRPLDPKQLQKATEAFVYAPFEVLEAVRPGLDKLKEQYKLGIMSNGLPSRHHDIHSSGLEPWFTDIIISSDKGLEKPNQTIYNLAAKQAKTQASKILLVDDLETNVEAALLAGYGQAILFSPAFWLPEQIASS